MSEPAIVRAIYRYPVKGLSAERLDATALRPRETLAGDRRYAIENGPSGFDPAAPAYFPKQRFLMLMKNERLARLDTRLEDASEVLVVRENGRETARGDLETATGRAAIEGFFADFCADVLRGPPRILAAPGHSFSDVARKVVSIVNLASVAAVEAMIGRPVDPLRFRANLYVAGWPAWHELDLAGAEVAIGGQARAKIVKRIVRCAATNVEPVTGIRDLRRGDRARRRRGGRQGCAGGERRLTMRVLVVGAGIVGLAIGREAALAGHEVVVAEAEAHIGTGTSSRNSEVIHAGLYYPTGSLRERHCARSRRMLYAYCASHGVPHKKTGKLVVACRDADIGALEKLHTQATRNGVEGLRMLTAAEAAAMEPALNCVAALHSPETGIIDSHRYMLALQGDLEDGGGVRWSMPPAMATRSLHARPRAMRRSACRVSSSPRATTFLMRAGRRSAGSSIRRRRRAGSASTLLSILPAAFDSAPTCNGSTTTISTSMRVGPHRSTSPSGPTGRDLPTARSRPTTRAFAPSSPGRASRRPIS
jgi:uncharacterized protein YcbX